VRAVGCQSWKDCVAANQVATENVAAEAVRSGARRFIYMSSAAVRGRVSGVPITAGDGNNQVDLIYVGDLARIVALTLERQDTVGQTYVTTNPGNPTGSQSLAEVCGHLGLPPAESHIPYGLACAAAWAMEIAGKLSGKNPRLSRYAVRVVRRPYTYVTEKIEKDLGFRPSVDLIDGVKRCLEAYR